MSAIKWASANWEGILAVVGAMLTVLSSLKQLLERFPRALRVLNVVIDVLSLVPQKGKRGVLGRMNLPGVPSLPPKRKDDDDDEAPPVVRIPLGRVARAAIFVGFILPFIVVTAGCGMTKAQWRAAGIDVARCL